MPPVRRFAVTSLSQRHLYCARTPCYVTGREEHSSPPRLSFQGVTRSGNHTPQSVSVARLPFHPTFFFFLRGNMGGNLRGLLLQWVIVLSPTITEEGKRGRWRTIFSRQGRWRSERHILVVVLKQVSPVPWKCLNTCGSALSGLGGRRNTRVLFKQTLAWWAQP